MQHSIGISGWDASALSSGPNEVFVFFPVALSSNANTSLSVFGMNLEGPVALSSYLTVTVRLPLFLRAAGRRFATAYLTSLTIRLCP